MKQRYALPGIIIGSAVAIGVVWTLYAKWSFHTKPDALVFSNKPYSPPAVAFKGKSHDLKQSVIVPTLDTPMPAGKNIIWCAPFQMAWDHLKDDVVKEPVRIAHAEIVAKRLNRSPVSENDLPENTFYAAAGWVKDGIVRKIRQEMQERFHKEPVDLDDPGAVLVAYGYLRAQVPFTIPYFENTNDFFFTDSEGRKTAVASFGLREEDEFAYEKLREQFESLYVLLNHGQWGDPVEFAIDLCKDSKPNQLILARIPRKENLQAMVEDVERKIAEHPAGPNVRRIICDAQVLIPSLNWSITHHFVELEGPDNRLLNRGLDGLWVATALQEIDFRLDRSGVELESEAKIVSMPKPTSYIVNQPFLIYVKKRGAGRPFFVMWVDNAELLSKPQLMKATAQ